MVQLLGELGYPTSKGEMAARFGFIASDAGYCTLIAGVNDQAVRLIGLHKTYMYEKSGIHVRIIALVVRGECRGQGIGRMLIAAAENWAKQQGAGSMSLNSGNRSEREAAHLFSQRLGFTARSTGYTKIIS
ncbi:GNAT family N-acetyltransferase [Paenibacillus sacheonensis]|uniref:GNAT family N-acetyltransferase n=1 Tax=Paenibacillus sacheonensis TaxID=742054 RepID=A0A7X4YPP0_9BACL|nr:GNAT superfamily N-acetyltransferase [Paenibacillus sacheonensis]NBC70256.1 GNAT family N-acetyltransferase [Paenibacillus sacheonensis]